MIAKHLRADGERPTDGSRDEEPLFRITQNRAQMDVVKTLRAHVESLGMLGP